MKEAEAWFRRAAVAGDRRAEFNLGLLLERRGEVEEAKAAFRRSRPRRRPRS